MTLMNLYGNTENRMSAFYEWFLINVNKNIPVEWYIFFANKRIITATRLIFMGNIYVQL